MTGPRGGKVYIFFITNGNKLKTKNNEKDGNGMDFTVRIAWFLR